MESIFKEHGVVMLDYMYFTSDEEIKEGDWYLFEEITLQCVNKAEAERCNGGLKSISDVTKKIIATTDPKLNDKYFPSKHNIAKIPQSFIESYTKNPVDKVELEYECQVRANAVISDYLDWTTVSEFLSYGLTGVERREIPKLTNNEVSIKIPSIYNTDGTLELVEKKMYTRDEVERLCRSAFEAGEHYSFTENFTFVDEEVWITTNL
jgi:hypothetical protein